MKISKNIFGILLICLTLFTSGCSIFREPISTNDDDMYYSLAEAKNGSKKIYNEEVKFEDQSPANSSNYSEQQTPNQNAAASVPAVNSTYIKENTQVQYADESLTPTVVNNYYGNSYDEEEYYYATRLSRFNSPYIGFGYYSPAYCGFYADPFFNPGLNFGYGWNSFSGWNVGFGFGYYNPWFSPYSYYNPWGFNNGFYNGYNNGYNNGYYDNNGGHNYSKNTVYQNTPRNSSGRNVGSNGRPTSGTNMGIGSANNTPSRPTPSTTNNTNNSILSAPTNGIAPTRGQPSQNSSPTIINNGYTAPNIPERKSVSSTNAGNTRTTSVNPNAVATPKSDQNAAGIRNSNPSTSRPNRYQNNGGSKNESRSSYSQPRQSSSPSSGQSRSASPSSSPSRNRPR